MPRLTRWAGYQVAAVEGRAFAAGLFGEPAGRRRSPTTSGRREWETSSRPAATKKHHSSALETSCAANSRAAHGQFIGQVVTDTLEVDAGDGSAQALGRLAQRQSVLFR